MATTVIEQWTQAWKTVKEGDERSFTVENVGPTHFVKYAGAGGDFNPMHHDDAFAKSADLPGVFGMGMFAAGVLSRIPTEWFGPTAVQRYGFKFNSRLWPANDVVFSGRVTRVYEEGGVKHADLELSAVTKKGENLIQGNATVRPWSPKK